MSKRKVTAISKFGSIWLVFTTYNIYCFGSKKDVDKFVKKFTTNEK